MAHEALQPWETLKTCDLFVAAPWIKVSVQQVRLPDGKLVDDYYQIGLPEYAIVFAQTADARVIVERQYKHGVGKVSLMLPAGLIENGETPLAAAQRELLEETGYVSDDWQPLGSFVANGNYGCGRAHLFTARNAREIAAPHSGDLEEMEIMRMELEDLIDAVRTGDVALLAPVAAIALATNPLFAAISGDHGTPPRLRARDR
jgi:ADP-ribose pyrophosphatase